MTFYSELSAYYDEIFPPDPAEIAFVTERLGSGDLLDVGCGTGSKTAFLQKKGRSITGIDSDRSMIEHARRLHGADSIHYETLSMEQIPTRFARKRFAGIVCLGNTLVHACDPARIAEALSAFWHISLPRGRLILQILNYDRILDQAITTLPDIETRHVLFTRRYERQSALLRFRTGVRIKVSGKTFENDIPLYPLRHGEMMNMLDKAGYKNISCFGNYDEGPLSPDSFMSIAVANA